MVASKSNHDIIHLTKHIMSSGVSELYGWLQKESNLNFKLTRNCGSVATHGP
jgi:hypothetical protein